MSNQSENSLNFSSIVFDIHWKLKIGSSNQNDCWQRSTFLKNDSNPNVKQSEFCTTLNPTKIAHLLNG